MVVTDLLQSGCGQRDDWEKNDTDGTDLSNLSVDSEMTEKMTQMVQTLAILVWTVT